MLLEKIYNKNNRLFLLLFSLAVFIPLLVINPWFVPLGFGKTIVFRILVSLALFIFIVKITSDKIFYINSLSKLKSVSNIIYPLLAYLSLFFLSAVFSLDRTLSFWGEPTRSGGFVNFLFYCIFAILLFLSLEEKDWQKIFNFSIITGWLVCLVAVFQQFEIYSNFFIPFSNRPVSTIGNPIFVAIFLNFTTALTIIKLLKNQKRAYKIFYIASIIAFLATSIVLTQTRAALLGLLAGILWFLLRYPKNKKTKAYVISVVLFFFISTFGLKIYLDNNLDIYSKFPKTISQSLDRALSLYEGAGAGQSRIALWKISSKSLLENPVLGFGPENFSIAFEKYYEPSLLSLESGNNVEEVQWWDRAHNFILDIGITNGIPALIAYIIFFAVLFWQLGKVKNSGLFINSIILQSTIIAYLTAVLFIFDFFDICLMLFIIIAYGFFTIYQYKLNSNLENNNLEEKNYSRIYKKRNIIIASSAILLILFLWGYNINPFLKNTKINMAYDYEVMNNCKKAEAVIDEIWQDNGIIGNYIRITAVNILYRCNERNPELNSSKLLSEKSIKMLEMNIKKSPSQLISWLLIGQNKNFLMDIENKLNSSSSNSQKTASLKDEANYYFSKAASLSPKRQAIYREWAKTGIIFDDYKLTEEKSQKCIDLNQSYSGCYWLMALSKAYQNNFEAFDYYSKTAEEKGYDKESEESLQQLVNMYIKINDYKNLASVYEKLILISKEGTAEEKNKKAQIYASLAVVYRDLGEIEKARDAAMTALKLQPEAKAIVDEFLKTLK